MQSLLNPAELMNRVEVWTEEEIRAKRISKGSWRLLREAILVGEFPRSRAAELTGYQDRQARTVLSELIAKGVLASDTPKGPVRLGFPSTVIERWFPGKELGVRVARRGWSAPDNFDETIAIYAGEGALAAMLTDVWKADTLKELLDLHHIDLPGMAND